MRSNKLPINETTVLKVINFELGERNELARAILSAVSRVEPSAVHAVKYGYSLRISTPRARVLAERYWALEKVMLKRRWEAHHKHAVIEGGGGCGLDGYETLCVACHSRETAALAQRRAERRREERAREEKKFGERGGWVWIEKAPNG